MSDPEWTSNERIHEIVEEAQDIADRIRKLECSIPLGSHSTGDEREQAHRLMEEARTKVMGFPSYYASIARKNRENN